MYYGPCAKYTLAATKARGGKAFGHWFHLQFPDNFSGLICESWDWGILALWKCNRKICITNTRRHKHDSLGWLTSFKNMICNVTITYNRYTKYECVYVDMICVYMCVYVCICIWKSRVLAPNFLIAWCIAWCGQRTHGRSATLHYCLGFLFVKMVDSGPIYLAFRNVPASFWSRSSKYLKHKVEGWDVIVIPLLHQPNRSKMVRHVRIVWLNVPWACQKLHFQVSLWFFPSLPLHLPTSRVAAHPSASSLSAAARSAPVVQRAGAGPWQPKPQRKGSIHLLATLARYQTINLWHDWSDMLPGVHAVSETIWLLPHTLLDGQGLAQIRW